MRKNIVSVLTITLIVLGSYSFFEPQLTKAWGPGTGPYADPITVTQDVSAEISLDSPADVNMSASIPGMTGGSATGQATWTIATNNNTGFKLELEASTDPALQGVAQGDSFADYTETAGGVPDFDWSVAESDAEFGYTVEAATAADLDQSFMDNAGATPCNTAGASQTADKCWIGFAGAGVKEQVINRTTETAVAGEAEVVKFKAELNGPATDADGFLVEDTYTATVTATATMN
jgi:hypothetical protein